MYKNVLVPVLVDESHDNQKSYAVARALAENGAKFTVLHVMETIPGYVIAEIPSDMIAKTHDEIEQYLIASAKDLPGSVPVLISGHSGRTIVEYANDHDVDCIVLVSHRPGFEDLFLGSTASRVVRHAKCSVHVIR